MAPAACNFMTPSTMNDAISSRYVSRALLSTHMLG